MIATATLPRRCMEILAAKPGRGGGLNRWLMSASMSLRRGGLDDLEIIDTLRDATACDAVRAGEIERAVSRSVDYLDADFPANDRANTSTPIHHTHRAAAAKFPDLDTALRAQVIAANGCTVEDLEKSSPVHFGDELPHTDEIIRKLFPSGSLLCVADKLEKPVTLPLENLSMLGMRQFIVPSVMSAATGLTLDGHESPRCLDNVGPRRYLVVEQDQGTPDEQAAIITHLSSFAPLALVVHSGAKSLHAWFSCIGQPEATVCDFFAYACLLGGDSALWTKCQLVRMPDGIRRSEGARWQRQRVLYWDPAGLSNGQWHIEKIPTANIDRTAGRPAYFTEAALDAICEPTAMLILAVGEKSALSIAQCGYAAVGLADVWNWQLAGGESTGKNRDPITLASDLAKIDWLQPPVRVRLHSLG